MSDCPGDPRTGERDEEWNLAHASAETTLTASHKELHAAAVKHAMHKKEAMLSDGRPIALPIIPRSTPVCSVPPAKRFCKSVNYPVYRPSETQTFAELDFDSHAVFKKIVPHMRISERHFELPVIEKCRAHFREFLCASPPLARACRQSSIF